jgi:bifunctional non-homologous end joining protein LigD
MAAKRTRPTGAEKLAEYQAKRDFDATPEPSGAATAEPDATDAPRFVIQEHHARAMHWDLRLERDGLLPSWALPKGLPIDPKDNHLAVHTEDHPIEYLDFAGDIPEGEYGGGSMRVWDHGTYEPIEWTDRKVVVALHGRRSEGRYALFQTGRAGSGRERDWMIHRMDPPVDPTAEPIPATFEPMLATAATKRPPTGQWGYELKWDGIRSIAFVEGGRARFTSRRGGDITARYPELRALGRALGSTRAILDGEIVSFDPERGRPDFHRLQQRMHVEGEHRIRRLSQELPVTYMIFDLVWLDGHSLVDEPYEQRRARLADLHLNGPSWQSPPHEVGDGQVTTDVSLQFGLEGVMAKALDRPYEPGRRSSSWLKIKNGMRQELVVGGWMPGERGRTGSVGSLLVGYYDDSDTDRGALVYAGRVGSGLTQRDIDWWDDALAASERRTSPFDRGSVPRGARFVDPSYVVEVRFTEWTPGGGIRQPVYLGRRDDKPATEVVRELR